MERDLKFIKEDYIPDEGEIYLEEQYQGKSGKRNIALFIFLSLAVPVMFLMFFIFVVIRLFF